MDDKGYTVAWMVTDVLEGRLSLPEAKQRLKGDPKDYNLLFHEARRQELMELMDRIGAASTALHALTMTELGVAAAALFPAETRGYILTEGALRLIALDDPAPAFDFLERAVSALEADEPIRLRASRLRLHILALMSRHEEFRRDCPSVVAEAERLDSPVDLSMALMDQADVTAETGDARTALDTVRVARRVRATVRAHDEGPVYSLATFAYRHALIARQAGLFEETVEVLEEARELAFSAGDPAQAARMLRESGRTWEFLGERERSARMVEQAAAAAERLGLHDWATEWRGESADGVDDRNEEGWAWRRASVIIQRQPEHAAESVPLLRMCIAEARRLHHPAYEADARHALGIAHGLSGNRAQAEVALRTAVRVAERNGDTLRVVRFRIDLVRNLIQQTKVHQALMELAPSIELGERLRAQAATIELRQSVAVVLAEAYDAEVFVTVVLHQVESVDGSNGTAESPSRPRLLLELGQRARAATMTEALRVGEVVEASADQGLGAAVLRLRAAEAALQLAAAEFRGLAQPIAEREHAAGELERAAASAGRTLRVNADPVPAEELAGALAPGEVLVDLLAVAAAVTITCLSSDGSTTSRLFKWDGRTRRRTLVRLQRARREYLNAHPDDLHETRALAEESVSRLDAGLFAAIARAVGEVCSKPPVRLFVSPENELFQLPYWRLAGLFAGCAVSVLPTPGALPLLRARCRDGRRPWISVSDPSRTLRHTARDIPESLGYQPCPPETEALLAALPGAGRIHFACHGHFDPDSAYRSGLAVAPSSVPDPLGAREEQRRAGLELFTAAQITGRLLLPHCALVVLSACDSGLPRHHAASEFTSLPGAFLTAGARNVIASLWPAHDAAAALLMNTFHTEAATSPTSFSAALATARQRLASISRTEAATLLGTEDLPPFDPPFADSVYTDCFQHYGVD
ncbi:CHAT domain-containing protein [Streptomyces antarcticus]|uniref:CHAT domain-containing protein n=1 Tax=Streptomyces antarcticus TaxID=2996458 RepID=UPI0022713F59|nr:MULTISPECIES: CHAT domain-containing protein [unclassified Streptomyces]MCY0947079.1 CHAT domain-containing protein [Streptomyces sp. H34-AA3]MCZ4084008.1 CHAT domain-containing protein [Streptomyces sp. H34-S5]